MKKASVLFITLTILISIVIGVVPQSAALERAYVEPSLLTLRDENISVIVTAADSTVAARAVDGAGGRVTSELWLVDAVAAVVPNERLPTLAGDPAVLSIVANKGVSVSERLPYDPINPFGLFGDQGWPVGMDVGANSLHDAGVTGDGVTIAVVDSGVYFAPDLIFDTEQEILIEFVGQANFVGDGECSGKSDPFVEIQRDGYCLRPGLAAKMPTGTGRTWRASSAIAIRQRTASSPWALPQMPGY